MQQSGQTPVTAANIDVAEYWTSDITNPCESSDKRCQKAAL